MPRRPPPSAPRRAPLRRLAVSLGLAAALAVLGAGCVATSPPAAGAGAPSPAAGPLRDHPARYDDELRDLVFEGSDGVRVRPGVRSAGDAAGLRRRARELGAARRWEEALGAAAAAVVAAPERPEGYEELAAALRRVKQTARAEAALRTALALDPHRVEASQALGEVLWSAGRREAAEEAWRRVVALDPDHRRALARLAVAAALRGDRDEAAARLEAAARAGAEVPAQVAGLLAGGGAASAAAEASFALAVDPPVRLDPGGGGHEAAEPAVGAVRVDGRERLLAAWIDTRLRDAGGAWRIAFAASEDGGRTWSPDQVLPPPSGSQTPFDADPTIAADARTGTLWLGAASFQVDSGVWVARQPAGAPAPSPAPPLAFSGFADRPWLAAGPLPGDPASARLYAAFSRGLLVSDDLGATWSPLLPFGGHSAGDGLGYLPRVGPGGELYVVFADFSDGIHLLRSLDGGASFEPPRRVATRFDFWLDVPSTRVPGRFRATPLPALAVAPTDGTLWVAWFDTVALAGGEADEDLFLARSDDGGVTWQPPRRLFAGPGDQFHPWIEVDGHGRLHLAFFDTGGRGADSDPAALLDVRYAASADGGETWAAATLTEEPFSTAGLDWNGFATTTQFVGDYLGLVPIAGGAFVAYPAASPAGDLDILGRRVQLLGGCPPDALCLGDGFALTVAWRTVAGDSGVGRPRPLTADSGAFWFFDEANLELVVKLLDACVVNGHQWVFAAGLTNVEVTLVVEHLASGERRTYTSPLGTAFQPVADTAAFSRCAG